MEKRYCPRCGVAAYSSDTLHDWECVNPMCRQIIKPPKKTGIEEEKKYIEVHRIFEEEQTDFAY